MRSCHRNRSNGESVTRRRNVDQAKAARAKAAIKAAKSQSPKSAYKNRKFRAAVDLETPKSLLVNIRLKSVINLETYDLLSRNDKERLFLVLPSCDQQKDRSGMPILNAEALNNEFFAKACVEWCERLGEGEFLKDRQQGDAFWKDKELGVLNSAKSHVIKSLSTATKVNRNNRRSILTESPLLHVGRLKNGLSVRQISSDDNAMPVPKRCHRHARNLRLQKLTVDDGASLVSETSSESSLSLHVEPSRVGSSRLWCEGDGNSSITLGNGSIGRVARREPLVNYNSGFFVHPALIDHDYADFTGDCKSRTSRVSTASGRYRRRRRKRKRKRVRSEKPKYFGAHRDVGPALEMRGSGCFTGDRSATSLSAEAVVTVNNVLRLNGAAVDCEDDVANSHALSLENSSPLIKSNGRLNGACLPNKREHVYSVQHLGNVADHDSCLKENDANLNRTTRPHRLKAVQHLRKLEQTDSTPLIQIQGSDLLSRLSCSKIDPNPSVRDLCNEGCTLLPCTTCFSKTELKANDNGDDSVNPNSESKSATSDINRLSTGHSNSVSGLLGCRTKPGRKFFVKLIGIQKIPIDREVTDGISNSRNVIHVSESDSSLDSIATSLPQSVLQEVQRYIHGGDLPYVGQHSSSLIDPSGGHLTVGRSVEISFPSNSIGSQEDPVTHATSRPMDFRENGLPCQNMQKFKLIKDLRNHRPNCSAQDLSDCVWEAVRSDIDPVDRGH